MKKVISQLKVQLTALLLVGGLLMLANCAQAQSTLQPQPTNGVKIPISGTWANSGQATSLLTTEINNVNGLLNQPGNGDVELMKYKVVFMEYILDAIAAGTPVNKAVQLSFDKVSAEIQPDSGTSSISQTELDAMLSEVVDLLDL